MKNYVLKITLRNSDISRTVAIPADYGFFDLHDVFDERKKLHLHLRC